MLKQKMHSTTIVGSDPQWQIGCFTVLLIIHNRMCSFLIDLMYAFTFFVIKLYVFAFTKALCSLYDLLKY